MRILEPFETRLSKIIKYDVPEFITIGPQKGRPFWRTGMTRAMLITMMRSLLHGELSVGKGVSVSEALTTFEYENIPIGNAAIEAQKLYAAKMLKQPGSGVSKDKHQVTAQDIVTKTCEQIAHAIATWPRLEYALDAALAGTGSSCTCTATRVWVKFIAKPQLVMERSDKWLSIARKWQHWCFSTLVSIGIVHGALVQSGVIDSKSREASAHAQLVKAVENHPLGNLLMVQYDHGKTRNETVSAGEQFAYEMRANTLSGHSAGTGPVVSQATESIAPGQSKYAGRYARACMALSESIFHNTPSFAMLFTSACMDDSGKTPERTQLTKSLKARGITVVRWSDSDEKSVTKPLIFPPHWRAEHPAPHAPHAPSNLPMLLLDFSNVR
jgi:hypothetical protein